MEPIFEQFIRDLTGGFEVPVWATMLVALVAVIAFVCLNAMFLIWLERKICGRIQRRLGPMLTGPKSWALFSMWTGGWLQTPCDSLKLLFKEDIIPAKADRFGFILAPILVFMLVWPCTCPCPSRSPGTPNREPWPWLWPTWTSGWFTWWP